MSIARLSGQEIAIMRSLLQRGGHVRPISLLRWQRPHVVSLFRRSLVEVWYRQSLDAGPMHGPFYSLTMSGVYLASSFFPAPRGLSGAEQRR